MANKPFKSIAEMKGRKMRTSDPRLLAKNGVAGITLPLEEVFTGLQTGTVDMAEFGHLKYNEGLGLTDIAKYGIFPDFWNVHFITTVVINKNAWAKLPPDVQAIVEMEDGARIYCLMTDCNPNRIEIGMPVEMTYRLFHEEGGFYNYYWKAHPAYGD